MMAVRAKPRGHAEGFIGGIRRTRDPSGMCRCCSGSVPPCAGRRPGPPERQERHRGGTRERRLPLGATWAAVAGATLPELMRRLRHRTHTAALRYQHATDERNKEIAGRLGALFTMAATSGADGAEVVEIRHQN
jgi:hypothetical protein